MTFTVDTTGIANDQTVAISGDGTGVATATVTGGKATFTRSFDSTGTKNVQVSYGGSAIAQPAEPATATVEVGKITSTLTIAAGTPAVAGSAVPLTANAGGIPNGESVDFYVNGAKQDSAPVNNGSAVYAGWVPGDAGTYTVQARYAGSATVTASQSMQTGVTVTAPINQTATTLVVNPAPTPGSASTLTATVTGGQDGDTVAFTNHGTEIGTTTLSGGVASIEWTPAAGQANQSYSLVARYAGSEGFAPSASAPETGTVGRIQAAVTDVTADATATVGEQVVLSATVSGGEAGQIIEFRDGDTVLETVTLPASGVATAYWTPTATGEYHVTAHYDGTSTTTPAQSPQATTVTVGLKASSIELTGPTSSSVGSSETLTAETTGIADGQTITFEIQGEQSRPAQVADGKASIDWTPTTTGSHTIRAVYAGSDTVAGSESVELVVVVDTRQTTTSTVTASADPKTGVPVTLSATVDGGAEGVDVQFRNGDQVLCTAQVGADGTASCEWTPEQVSDVAVTAHYAGNETTSASQSGTATTVSVAQGDVAAPSGLTISPATPTAADILTVSGTAPAGSEVTVFLFTNNSECTATADASGAFQCELGTLPAGQHELNAYALLNNEQSGTTTLPVSVSTISTNIELAGPGSIQPGETADLSLTTTGIADGEQVDILVNGEKKGSATVTGGEATYQWLAEATGTFTITASYAGNASTEAATSAPLTITVDEAATQTSGVTAPGSVTIGETVPLQATVTRGTPGVDVQFRTGTDVLCTGQVAADGS
ncbi:Ig-like domain repeat protein, partial [Dietzia aerolata]|nr:Ig-like domain repeat protein [Dietzia aerolata]